MTSMSVDDSYLSHYGFNHDPFAGRVPGFKFFPAQRKPVLGQLHHLARYSQLLLLVTGPTGSGKSLLRQALVASSNRQTVQSVVVTPQVSGSAEEMLGQIARALGGRRAAVDAVMAQIGQATLTGQEVYLLVDDAEQLTDDALEALLALAAGGPEGRAHVFLFGEPELAGRLAGLSEAERFHAIELQPYSEDETGAYLKQRLQGAGAELDCLSAEQVALIHRLSQGWPGRINQVAREVLIDALPKARETQPARAAVVRRVPALPKRHLAAIGLVLVGVALVMLVGGREDRVPEATVKPLPLGGGSSVHEAVTDSDRAPVVKEDMPVIREPLAAVSAGEEDDNGAVELPPSIDPVEPAPVAALAPALPKAEPSRSQPVPAGAPLSPGVAVSSPVAKPVTQAQAKPPIQPATKPVAPAKAPAQAAVTAPVVKPTSPQPQQAKPVAAQSRPAVEAPKVAATAKPVSTATASGVSGWYVGQPSSNYVVQVLGTRSEATARNVLSQYGSAYRYYVKQHQGQPLYVVTFGNFASRQAAMDAVKGLPAALQSGKPWARTLASIQQEIRQAR